MSTQPKESDSHATPEQIQAVVKKNGRWTKELAVDFLKMTDEYNTKSSVVGMIVVVDLLLEIRDLLAAQGGSR